MNILIIQQISPAAELLAEAITSWGHKTSWSETGEDALRRTRRRNYDLVIMDVFLPDMRGDELIRQIKELRPEAAIVAMTDNNSRELELTVRKEGVIYYMVRPFRLTIFKHILDHTMRKKQAQYPKAGNHSGEFRKKAVRR